MRQSLRLPSSNRSGRVSFHSNLYRAANCTDMTPGTATLCSSPAVRAMTPICNTIPLFDRALAMVCSSQFEAWGSNSRLGRGASLEGQQFVRVGRSVTIGRRVWPLDRYRTRHPAPDSAAPMPDPWHSAVRAEPADRDSRDAVSVAVRRRRLAEHLFVWYTKPRYGMADPLCGMKAYRSVVPANSGTLIPTDRSIRIELASFTVQKGFASPNCRSKFAREPETPGLAGFLQAREDAPCHCLRNL